VAHSLSVFDAARRMTEVVAGSSTTDPEILDVQRHDEQIVVLLRVQPGLSWFDGHFPEVPLLPGVVQTSWVVQMGRRYFDLPPLFQSMSNMKFMRFIPGLRGVASEVRRCPRRTGV
jgi:3-hydroxymyristoyl/3-hydroxydecanoyl-(acyl carrier protein) dehydratase